MALTGKDRCAVVTGANKGIGFEICNQLASNGVKVVLTSRDEKRGIDALEKFKGTHLSDLIIFHQLDVTDPNSVASLAQFVKNQFGKLDILVNNCGIGGVVRDEEAFKASRTTGNEGLNNEWAKGILSDTENLTEEKIDEVVNEFLNDFKEGLLESKGWPTTVSAYMISKAAMNGYTRMLAKKYKSFCINCVCPGYVKTDINYNMGVLSTEDGAETPVKIALFPNGGPSGCFFDRDGVMSF
ncbi:hypothetical protein L2E82_14470 [Cichorium intybus]|uniref:Uncharacterized protein n=1 Tax=Cichorium intybus TaxID=13427 RepID=A0ACB9F0G1_CICIN|nr:hypothetical protein L2E82_14470 [Cichorium intybus]